jgi:hypothetical protein
LWPNQFLEFVQVAPTRTPDKPNCRQREKGFKECGLHGMQVILVMPNSFNEPLCV